MPELFEAEALFSNVGLARRQRDFALALRLLDEMHHRWHDQARLHVRIHWQAARTRAAQGRLGKAAWELVALCFAAPASWVQRYTGLARSGF